MRIVRANDRCEAHRECTLEDLNRDVQEEGLTSYLQKRMMGHREPGLCYFYPDKSRGEVLQITTDCGCTNELNIKSLIWLSQND